VIRSSLKSFEKVSKPFVHDLRVKMHDKFHFFFEVVKLVLNLQNCISRSQKYLSRSFQVLCIPNQI
jgi:hypothetical protein